MVSSRNFSFLIVFLFVSTFLVSSSSAETEEEVWSTARPEFRKGDNWCGTGTVYASVHEIQPISFGGIRLRGGTLIRLHGPHFELRSMFHKIFLGESFKSSFDDGINREQVPFPVETFYESAFRNMETEPHADLKAAMEVGFKGPFEVEGRETMAGESNTESNTEWDVDQNGVWLPKRNVEEVEPEFLGFQQNDSSLEEAPEWENNFATEVVDPRNTLEEQMMHEQLRDEFKFLQEEKSTNNVHDEGMVARTWMSPSEETLTDVLRYVLMVLIFASAFILVALMTSRRDVSDDEATVLVLNTPDHSTPLLQTYVVSDHSGDSVETGQMENGVVLYQPPEVGTEEKK